MKIKNNCVGCGQCVPICKYDAISVFGNAEINEKCIHCMTCIKYCPVKAIEALK
ncbi:MAG: 4Fe-4S binding protein [Methanosarcinaceae archaeon]|jgi:ferredoxin|nr:4Fe-4S binding protein [Methanosarcinaceae archaeon]NKQ37938.1 4Fe-4S binding protein [Methanosarcinales archaeon]